MRHSWLLLSFALASGTSLAADIGDAIGINKYGQRFVVAPDDGSRLGGYDSYVIYIVKGKRDSTYVNQPCKLTFNGSENEPHEFSCSSKGVSPLAGVTYSVNPVRRDCIWATYTCKSGCSPKVPEIIHESYWECPDVGL